GLVVQPGDRKLRPSGAERLRASVGDRAFVRHADDQGLASRQDRADMVVAHRRPCFQEIDAEADLRLAATIMTATAPGASRLGSESARLVRMMGARAPSTMPAESAWARNVRLLASMFPDSRSGTTSTFARPATGEAIFLMAAACGLIALSSASGPSSIAPR